MHKLLFVHEERFLDLAVRNVQELLAFEQRVPDRSSASDLLAVLLMSPRVVNELLSPEQDCDPQRFADRHSLFGPDSVSVNGRWILVTLSRPDVEEPGKRHEALDKVLDILRTQGFVRGSDQVFPVSTLGGQPLSIGEEIDDLRSEQPSKERSNWREEIEPRI